MTAKIEWENEDLARKFAGEGYSVADAARLCNEKFDLFRMRARRRGIIFTERPEITVAKHQIRSLVEGMKTAEAVDFLLNYIELNDRAHDPQEVALHIRDFGLTPKEAQLFAILFEKPGRVFDKEHLLSRLYPNPDDYAVSKIIDVYVCKIRKKLKDAWHPGEIKTQWGLGYYYEKAKEDARK